MTERKPFIAPDGTLFLLGDKDILLTTLDGCEATVSLNDLAAFLRHLETWRGEQAPEEDPPTRPSFRVFKGGE